VVALRGDETPPTAAGSSIDSEAISRATEQTREAAVALRQMLVELNTLASPTDATGRVNESIRQTGRSTASLIDRMTVRAAVIIVVFFVAAFL
jgi:hypothetical protein